MPETLNQFGEQEPKPIWKDLIEIEKLITAEMKKIDQSGPDFLAREELLKELRKRYNWYEKWASSTSEDREIWAEKSSRKLNDDDISGFYLPKFFDLAEKNYETALGVYAPGGIENTLDRVENATFESSAQELESIKALIKTADAKEVVEVVKKLLTYLSRFKKEIIYKDFTDRERSDLEDYIEMFESNIDDRKFLLEALPLFIDELAEIIRKKKKLIKE